MAYASKWINHAKCHRYGRAQQIAQDESVFIENPVLVIVALNKLHQEFGFYVLYQDQVYSYVKEETQPKNSEEEDGTK